MMTALMELVSRLLRKRANDEAALQVIHWPKEC